MSHCFKLIVGLLFVLSVVSYAFANQHPIICWLCNSSKDPECADPFDNSTVAAGHCYHKDQETVAACRKTRQQINGEWRYTRGCAFIDIYEALNQEKPCSTQVGTDNNLIENCTCYKDVCNSSYLSRSQPGVLGALLLTPYLVLKLVL